MPEPGRGERRREKHPRPARESGNIRRNSSQNPLSESQAGAGRAAGSSGGVGSQIQGRHPKIWDISAALGPREGPGGARRPLQPRDRDPQRSGAPFPGSPHSRGWHGAAPAPGDGDKGTLQGRDGLGARPPRGRSGLCPSPCPGRSFPAGSRANSRCFGRPGSVPSSGTPHKCPRCPQAGLDGRLGSVPRLIPRVFPAGSGVSSPLRLRERRRAPGNRGCSLRAGLIGRNSGFIKRPLQVLLRAAEFPATARGIHRSRRIYSRGIYGKWLQSIQSQSPPQEPGKGENSLPPAAAGGTWKNAWILKGILKNAPKFPAKRAGIFKSNETT